MGRVYAHIEQMCSSSNATLARTLSSSAISDGRILNLRLRADSLCSSHSVKNRLSVTKSKPNTFYEISQPSSGMVVYRSPIIKESVTPMWDEAMIELSSLFCSSLSPRSASALDDLSTYPIKISVYKEKLRKVKETGSFETNVQSLMDACRTVAKVTG